MIDFPSSPTNGQSTILAGNTYTFNTAKAQWQVTTPAASGLPTQTGNSGKLLTTNGTAASWSNTINSLISPTLFINRTGSSISGISWYSSSFTAWSQYMAPASALNVGPTGNITAPSGAFVTSWALRSFIENVAGYGWTFESGSTTGQPTVVAEMKASDGTFHTYGALYANSSITAMYSDRRLKTDIKVIENALDKVDSLLGMTFVQNDLAETFGYKDPSRQVGVFAQEVQVVLPEAVKIAPFDMDADGNSKSGENYLTVQYEKLVPLLIEAIKELRLEVKQLKGA